jgi:hypothetical protein
MTMVNIGHILARSVGYLFRKILFSLIVSCFLEHLFLNIFIEGCFEIDLSEKCTYLSLLK